MDVKDHIQICRGGNTVNSASDVGVATLTALTAVAQPLSDCQIIDEKLLQNRFPVVMTTLGYGRTIVTVGA